MVKIAHKPVFWVILRDRQQWAVEAEWPDGTIEQIDTFKAHSEALNWGLIPAHRINNMRPLAVGSVLNRKRSNKMFFRLGKARSPGGSNELSANFVAAPPGYLACALPDDTVVGKEQHKFIWNV